MYENIKIGLLGGDLRQLALARRLSNVGFETAVWGLGVCTAEIGSAVRCASWKDAVRGSNAVVLPLPASQDGVMLNCPLAPEAELRLTHIIDEVPDGALLLGGKFDASIKQLAHKKSIPLIDYYECEELQIKNALPTAEGALAIAMGELPITIFGCKAAIAGYGRVGKALAKVLCALGAKVTVAARNPEELAWAEINGCTPMRLETKNNVSTLCNLDRQDVIFNTVPVRIFDRAVLERLPKDTLLIDLATLPGGVDGTAAKELGFKLIRALSLPGKVAPFTAGNIIGDCIMEILTREGVLSQL